MAFRDPSFHADGPALVLRKPTPSGRDHRPCFRIPEAALISDDVSYGSSVCIYGIILHIGWCLNASPM